MSRYYRYNPEEPIRHEWPEGARRTVPEPPQPELPLCQRGNNIYQRHARAVGGVCSQCGLAMPRVLGARTRKP